MIFEKILEPLAIFGIMFFGYFIGRIIESIWIGSWNYPKKKESEK